MDNEYSYEDSIGGIKIICDDHLVGWILTTTNYKWVWEDSDGIISPRFPTQKEAVEHFEATH